MSRLIKLIQIAANCALLSIAATANADWEKTQKYSFSNGEQILFSDFEKRNDVSTAVLIFRKTNSDPGKKICTFANDLTFYRKAGLPLPAFGANGVPFIMTAKKDQSCLAVIIEFKNSLFFVFANKDGNEASGPHLVRDLSKDKIEKSKISSVINIGDKYEVTLSNGHKENIAAISADGAKGAPSRRVK